MVDDTFSGFDRDHQCDRQRDRKTDRQTAELPYRPSIHVGLHDELHGVVLLKSNKRGIL